MWELDTVRDGLTRAKIPFYVQTESFGGVRRALEMSPTAGFGTRWLVLVPTGAKREAETVLASLHVTFDSDRKYFPSITGKYSKKVYWIGGTLGIIIFLILQYLTRWSR